MPTCPNCGEIVMNGDPYCPNCGTTFKRSYVKGAVNEFKNFHFYAFDGYNIGNYEFAMNSLSVAFGKYMHMTNSQRARVKHMLERDWVVDLCCITINENACFQRRASEIIVEMEFELKQCEGCYCIYPAYYKFCTKCGKPLVWNYDL